MIVEVSEATKPQLSLRLHQIGVYPSGKGGEQRAISRKSFTLSNRDCANVVFFLPKIFSFWPGQKVQQQTTRRFGSGTRRSAKTTSFVVVVVVVVVGEDDLVQVFFLCMIMSGIALPCLLNRGFLTK